MEGVLIAFMYDLLNIIERFLSPLGPVLRHLDPSLFQNVIIGILAIFIPFTIVLLSDIVGSRRLKGEFEKMVLTEEVFGVKEIFWLSVIGIAILSFFSSGREEVSLAVKLFAILLLMFLIWRLSWAFRKVLRFSEGDKSEFELTFLKKLQLSPVLYVSNENAKKKMRKSWESLWAEKTGRLGYDEREFTKVFIGHVDDAIKAQEFRLSIHLSQIYQSNFNKRDVFWAGQLLLPKVFEWAEKLWREEQKQRQCKKEGRNYRKEGQYLGGQRYFQKKLFTDLARPLLLDANNSHLLFTNFKKYIECKEKRLGTSNIQKRNIEFENYIKLFLQIFFGMLFDLASNYTDPQFKFFEQDFPEEWKVSVSNSENWISRVMLSEFQRWEFFRKNSAIVDIGGLFPNVNPTLFSNFLLMFFSYNVKNAIERKQRLHIALSDFISEKQNEAERIEKEQSQKKETIDVIFTYFSDHWQPLRIWDAITDEERTQWREYSKEQREQIFGHVRSKNLKKLLEELESPEIKEFCEGDEVYEGRRRQFVELITLLLDRVEQEANSSQ